MGKVILLTEEQITEIVENALASIQRPKPEDDILQGDKAAAEFLGCSKTTIWKYKRKGLPFYNQGKLYLFRKSEILAWMQKNNPEL